MHKIVKHELPAAKHNYFGWFPMISQYSHYNNSKALYLLLEGNVVAMTTIGVGFIYHFISHVQAMLSSLELRIASSYLVQS